MQTSGLVLDVHDDVGGEQIKSFFPSLDAMPDLVKQAAALSPSDLSRLPDDAFALVLVNGEEKLRKYACVDGGNTALSVVYFIKNAHKLPDEARTRAAENLKVACGWYGLDVPEELEKEAGLGALVGRAAGAVSSLAGKGAGKVLGGAANMAGGAIKSRFANDPIGTTLTAINAPSMYRGTRDAIKDNLAKVRAGEAMGGIRGGLAEMGGGIHLASANPEYLALEEAFKVAEITGTTTAPVSKDGRDSDDSGPEHTIKKTSSTGRLVEGHRGETSVGPDVAAPVEGKNPVRAPQHMSPVVDVTGKEPRKESKEKKASRYALPSHDRYPLDSYDQVKQASAYFEENAELFDPVDRHEYCVNLVKRASELSVPLSDRARKYGSEKYASATEFEAALQMRRSLLEDRPQESALLSKLATAASSLSPLDFAVVLSEFDRANGLHHQYDRTVYDPYYSTFGFEKSAAEDLDSWSDTIGNYHVTGRELSLLALNHHHKLFHQFGKDFAEEFKKDPLGIYNSMPTDQKILIIRLATDNAPV